MTYPKEKEILFPNMVDNFYEQEMNVSLYTLKEKLERRKREIKAVSSKLKHYEEELVKNRTEMEGMSKELWETNHAMSVLAKNIDGKRAELEEKVYTTIRGKIMPIIKDLKNEESIKKFWPEINSVAEYLNGIATKNNLYYDAIIRLTDKEMKIAAMIKDGMTSKEIAELMRISMETVKAHRKNIRKKLKICNTKNRLSSYLMSVLYNG